VGLTPDEAAIATRARTVFDELARFLGAQPLFTVDERIYLPL
jgi:hypothetical protein